VAEQAYRFAEQIEPAFVFAHSVRSYLYAREPASRLIGRLFHCRAIAIRSRSSGVIRWSRSSAASSMSSWTHLMRPVNRLSLGP
jgi:hypothetical protein